MAESTRHKVDDLLREGLDYYGADEIGKAILAWRRVLEIDPDNTEARDYLETADPSDLPGPGAVCPASDSEPVAEVVAGPAPLVLGAHEEAQQRIAREDYEGALRFLNSCRAEERCTLEHQAMVELVRSHLYASYRKGVGSLASIPELRADAASITQFNLPSDAGFVLSLVDGATSVADMLSVSGMDPFDTLRILQGLMQVEIVAIRA